MGSLRIQDTIDPRWHPPQFIIIILCIFFPLQKLTQVQYGLGTGQLPSHRQQQQLSLADLWKKQVSRGQQQQTSFSRDPEESSANHGPEPRLTFIGCRIVSCTEIMMAKLDDARSPCVCPAPDGY